MENRLLKVLRRLVRCKSKVDDAFVLDAARGPDFLRVRVTPNMRREAIKRIDNFNRDSRQASVQRVDHAGNNAICYLTADGSVFGPIGSSFRVRTRKHGRAGRAHDDLADANEVG